MVPCQFWFRFVGFRRYRCRCNGCSCDNYRRLNNLGFRLRLRLGFGFRIRLRLWFGFLFNFDYKFFNLLLYGLRSRKT
jgi:hypothetical protein